MQAGHEQDHRSSTGLTYFYYICNKKERHQTCKAAKINRDEVEKAVIDHLYHNLLNNSKIDNLVEEINKAMVSTATDYEAELKKLHSGISITEDKLIDLAAETGNNRVKEKIQEQQRLDILETRQKEIFHNIRKIMLTTDQVRDTLRDFIENEKRQSRTSPSCSANLC